ncbi:MAG: helix-turn-helix transcriptional regulator [Chloroflexia bacterium]|jgi:transcriptional regulator with XRE-family HTH domain|nr:helix-turn-helix transcriptional regulator [Chloroflexia bacterium]
MKNLNHLRIEADYSIADLARMMAVDEQTACRWLCGRAFPNPEEIQRLAAIFSIDPQSLVPDPAKQPGRSDKLRFKFSTAGGRLRHNNGLNGERTQP